MRKIEVYTPFSKPNLETRKKIEQFLFEHLENFGDPQEDIEKCMDFALKEVSSFGGFVLASVEEDEVIGAVIVNQTGMKDYIPENILVYIATHNQQRGKGIGKELMKKTIEMCNGDIALHVEPDNPARFLYEKFGFGSKYIEMRFKQ